MENWENEAAAEEANSHAENGHSQIRVKILPEATEHGNKRGEESVREVGKEHKGRNEANNVGNNPGDICKGDQ